MSKLFKSISFISIVFILLYLSPLIFSLPNWDLSQIYPEVIFDSDYQNSLLRTISFAVISTSSIIIFSFLLGYSLRRVKNNKFLVLGSLLILPFLLGSVSTSFLFKILLFDTSVLAQAFNNSFLLFGILTLIQFWQFGTLFTYIFWLNNLNIDERIIDYSNYYKFNTLEKIKNIFLPYHRNLIILLSVFFFVSNIYETVKLQIIFKASKGTNSELLSQTLYNSYLSDSKISPDFAAEILFSQTTLFYLPIFILAVILLYLVLNRFIKIYSRTKYSIPNVFSFQEKYKDKIALFVLYCITASVLFPIVYAFLIHGIKISNVKYLMTTLGLSFLASFILISLITLPFSYYLRINKKNIFNNINNKSIWVFIILFLLFLVPPLTLMLFGFEWSNILGIRGTLSTNIFWLVGQCVSALPIVASFVFVIHFFTKNKEIEYLNIMNVNFSEIIKWSFFKKYKIEYLMTFLFAFSIIWNEGTFNRVYSDRIPSYVSEILRTVNSRNADYEKGMMYFLFSVLLGFVCIIFWNVIITRFSKANSNS